jgi:hypothetical protein
MKVIITVVIIITSSPTMHDYGYIDDVLDCCSILTERECFSGPQTKYCKVQYNEADIDIHIALKNSDITELR